MTKIQKYLSNSQIIIISLLLLSLIWDIGVFIYQIVFAKDYEAAFSVLPYAVITLLFILLYIAANSIFKRHLGVIADEYYYIAIIFTFFSLYLGSLLNFYERFPWWDIVLHFSSGIILCFLGISIISLFFGKTIDEKGDVIIILIFGVLVSVGIGVLWEFYEYSYDILFDGNMQRTVQVTDASQLQSYISPNGYFRDPGLTDTMKDLLNALLGALIATAFSYPRLRRNNVKVFLKNQKIDASEIKYIAIDLDGTLLNSAHTISAVNKEAISKAIADGLKIILCSGRPTRDMRDYAHELNLYENECYLVSYNGAKAYSLHKDKTEKMLFEVNFTLDESVQVANLVKDRGNNYIAYSDDGYHVRDIEHFRETYKNKLDDYNLDNNYTGTDIVKSVIYDEPQNINLYFDEVFKQVKELYPHFNVFTSAPKLLEICPADAAKGVGLAKLFNLIGASNENLIVFGDQNNDVSMFEYAKYSVAMANATSQVKAISTHNTVTNDRSGVGVFIEQKILKNNK